MSRDSTARVIALIVAAGRGSRSGLGQPKQYHSLGGFPVLTHTVDSFRNSGLVDDVIVVIHGDDRKRYESAMGGRRILPPAIGAEMRSGSVVAGLEAIAGTDDDPIVLIHDAARPFVPKTVITRLVEALVDAEGAVPVLPVVDTLLKDGKTVDRTGLLRVQTPQAFRLSAISGAHRTWQGEEPTDDAMVARAAGLRVAEVQGHEKLRKLTMPEDIAWAESEARGVMTSRVGSGFDVHTFGAGDKLWLGGVEIAHSQGLVGHSDADVVLHALTDAILGAIGEGDIGTHFPPSEDRWRGAASAQFVEHARELVASRGGIIDHVDVTIICEQPKIGPHRASMRGVIAGLLQVDESRVSIKATTTEKLGFTGRGEGIAAQAIASIRLPDMVSDE